MMRVTAFVLAAAFALAAGSAWACPMHTAGKDQTVASSSKTPSTPIPPRSEQGGNG
jgi:hypothetical protein